MRPEAQRRGACAVLVICVPRNLTVCTQISFPCICCEMIVSQSIRCLLFSSDVALYNRAILYPKGSWSLSSLSMRCACHCALVSKHLRQPVNALANFRYWVAYAHERLPPDVGDAFG
ncbi:hypothetical protein BDR04DRAFT_1192099 [Suillus decipiens]|nr:hypothetical protein BDR04DRAFT_1192099 [Suillus decipiens]